jgi:hypothetical protein
MLLLVLLRWVTEGYPFPLFFQYIKGPEDDQRNSTDQSICGAGCKSYKGFTIY